MKTKILKTDWFLGKNPKEGTVTILSALGGQIEAFSYNEEFTVNEEVHIELCSLDQGINWKAQIAKEKEISLKYAGDWSYAGYGKVVSVHPVILDFGEFQIDSGDWSNDQALLGEIIFLKIDKLDIIKK